MCTTTIGWTACRLGVGLALLMTASAGDAPLQLDGRNHGQSIATSVGRRIDVSLQTIGPGQYGEPRVTSSAVRFIGIAPTGPPNPGGPRQLFHFEAIAPGSAVIDIPHSRGTVFSVTINVAG
jgi:hypothetical protein